MIMSFVTDELTIVEAVNRMRKGELKAQDLVASCLERIRLRDELICAWVEVYEEQALEEARKCDAAAHSGKWRGDLHGIPVGVKDIIDVKGMWTRAGCSVYPARVAESDAPVVKQIRAAGAIILGKTETTAFANNDPAATRNPWNTEHTPGGSSSGSAAAVADRMCLAAVGTQTGGSVLRPAAYNGIVGFKPTYASISTEGVIPVSWSLDHVGSFARNIEDTGVLFGLMRDDRPNPFSRISMGLNNHNKSDANVPFRLGYFRKFTESEAAPAVIKQLESVRKIFEQAGAVIVDIDLTASLASAAIIKRVITDTELASYHRTLFNSHREQYPPNIKARIEKGMTIPGYEYVEAIHQRIAFQNELFTALSDVDAAIMPAAPSTAPKGLASTGSPLFCVPWSFSGFPAVTIPSGLDDQGLPLAVQIGSKPMEEEKLLAVAAWCETLLSFTSSPI